MVIVGGAGLKGHGAALKLARSLKLVREWAQRCHELARMLRDSAKPLLAAIHGTAVGGGLEMTLHCDLRFAATDARLGQPEIRIGFIPPIATTQALARLIERSATDARFAERLRRQCAARAALFAPAVERARLLDLVDNLLLQSTQAHEGTV